MNHTTIDRSLYPNSNYYQQKQPVSYAYQSFQQTQQLQQPCQQGQQIQQVQPFQQPFSYRQPNSPTKPMTPQPRTKQIDNYMIYLDYQVGSGASSVVYRGRDLRTQEEVCIKHVDCLALLPGQKTMVIREAQFLKQLNHPNILKCTEVLDSGSSLYIIGEYCAQGDIYEKLLK